MATYRGDSLALTERSQKAVERLYQTTGTAPQAFFVSLAVGQTQYLTSLLRSPVPPWVLLRPDAN